MDLKSEKRILVFIIPTIKIFESLRRKNIIGVNDKAHWIPMTNHLYNSTDNTGFKSKQRKICYHSHDKNHSKSKKRKICYHSHDEIYSKSKERKIFT